MSGIFRFKELVVNRQDWIFDFPTTEGHSSKWRIYPTPVAKYVSLFKNFSPPNILYMNKAAPFIFCIGVFSSPLLLLVRLTNSCSLKASFCIASPVLSLNSFPIIEEKYIVINVNFHLHIISYVMSFGIFYKVKCRTRGYYDFVVVRILSFLKIVL